MFTALAISTNSTFSFFLLHSAIENRSQGFQHRRGASLQLITIYQIHLFILCVYVNRGAPYHYNDDVPPHL